MDPIRPTEAQAREHPDPHEGNAPIPTGFRVLIAGLVIFATWYLLTGEYASRPELGDHRTLADLVPKAEAAAKPGAALDGAPIYAARCAACHQPTGAGLPGVFPPLAGSEWVQGKADTLAKILLQGINGSLTVKGATYNGAMPPFRDQLKDDEVAAVATHLRSQWGNTGGPVPVDVVAKARADTASHAAPWNGDAELSALK
jgi:mono/diheme cytochrome c family protein